MTDETKPNAELAYRVLDHIDAHPEMWDQERWVGTTECGTIACFAGWACLLSGDKSWNDTDMVRTLGGDLRMVPVRARELLRIETDIALCHASGYGDDDALFDEENDRQMLGRMVEDIFGPRPTDARPQQES